MAEPDTGGTQEPTPEGGNNEKTFTQAELDRIVGERLARDRKNYPDQEQLKAFEEWKKGQQSAEEKAAEAARKLQDAQERRYFNTSGRFTAASVPVNEAAHSGIPLPKARQLRMNLKQFWILRIKI